MLYPPRVHCPFCEAEDTRVIDSRPAEDGTSVRRRRHCEQCGNRFTTFERAVLPLVVRKRDGRTEPFDLAKVRTGVERALAGRPLDESDLEGILARVEAVARAAAPEVSSHEIGRVVLQGLRAVDEAAYLRFASVYKDFRGARDFEKEMAELEDV